MPRGVQRVQKVRRVFQDKHSSLRAYDRLNRETLYTLYTVPERMYSQGFTCRGSSQPSVHPLSRVQRVITGIQEAGDLLAVVATGSTAGGRLERWMGQLALCSIVLVAFDADPAGDEASAWWLKALGPRAKRWRPYWGDTNKMLQDGIDLRSWVREGLGQEPRWWREVARWPDDRREEWAERASIFELDGGLGRDEAEREVFGWLAGR